MKIEIKRKFTGPVLFETEAPSVKAAVEMARNSESDLSGDDLSDTKVLEGVKSDLFAVLKSSPREVAGLKKSLVAGKINGSVYEGECACLVGTIANLRRCDYRMLGPNPSRPAERWFAAINPGDTPKNNPIAKIALDWVEEFQEGAK